MKSSNSRENAERRSSVIHFSQIIYYYESISKSLKEIYTAVYKNLLQAVSGEKCDTENDYTEKEMSGIVAEQQKHLLIHCSQKI